MQSYTDVYLRSERVLRAVSTGGLSSQDFRDVFRLSVERRVRSLPDIDGLSKETVLTSWMVKFDAIFKGVGEDDSRRPGGGGSRSQQQQQQALQNQSLLHSEQPLPKEQLYDLFQQILGVKKFEHQLLFNALQVRHTISFQTRSFICHFFNIILAYTQSFFFFFFSKNAVVCSILHTTA